MRTRRGLWMARALAFGTILFVLLGLLTMALWNAIAVDLFAAPAITFWQAVGLMVLGRLITGNFGPRGWRGGGPPWAWRNRTHFRERWQNMSEAERQQLMQRWGGDRACSGPWTHAKPQDQRSDPGPTITES